MSGWFTGEVHETCQGENRLMGIMQHWITLRKYTRLILKLCLFPIYLLTYWQNTWNNVRCSEKCRKTSKKKGHIVLLMSVRLFFGRPNGFQLLSWKLFSQNFHISQSCWFVFVGTWLLLILSSLGQRVRSQGSLL